jgi:hypothetical protein
MVLSHARWPTVPIGVGIEPWPISHQGEVLTLLAEGLRNREIAE